MGRKVAQVVKPALPSLDVQRQATDLAKAKLAAHGQINLQKTVVVGGDDSSKDREPPPRTKSQPAGDGGRHPVTVHRTKGPANVFALRAQTTSGKSSCTAYPTLDECSQTCTGMLRASSMNPKLRDDPDATASCSCLEQERGC